MRKEKRGVREGKAREGKGREGKGREGKGGGRKGKGKRQPAIQTEDFSYITDNLR